jgi:hypothetical protein
MNVLGQVFDAKVLRPLENASGCAKLAGCGVVLAPLAFAQPGVGPLEALGHDVTDIGEVEEEEGNADDGVEYGDKFADWGDWSDMPIA